MKKTLIITASLLVLVLLAVSQRHRLMFGFLGNGEPPALLEPAEESSASYWHDDYFLVEQLDSHTYAIAERAVLFDAGPGYRDIRSVAESLTDLPNLTN